jgi:hypothetical protein
VRGSEQGHVGKRKRGVEGVWGRLSREIQSILDKSGHIACDNTLEIAHTSTNNATHKHTQRYRHTNSPCPGMALDYHVHLVWPCISWILDGAYNLWSYRICVKHLRATGLTTGE